MDVQLICFILKKEVVVVVVVAVAVFSCLTIAIHCGCLIWTSRKCANLCTKAYWLLPFKSFNGSGGAEDGRSTGYHILWVGHIMHISCKMYV